MQHKPKSVLMLELHDKVTQFVAREIARSETRIQIEMVKQAVAADYLAMLNRQNSQ